MNTLILFALGCFMISPSFALEIPRGSSLMTGDWNDSIMKRFSEVETACDQRMEECKQLLETYIEIKSNLENGASNNYRAQNQHAVDQVPVLLKKICKSTSVSPTCETWLRSLDPAQAFSQINSRCKQSYCEEAMEFAKLYLASEYKNGVKINCERTNGKYSADCTRANTGLDSSAWALLILLIVASVALFAKKKSDEFKSRKKLELEKEKAKKEKEARKKELLSNAGTLDQKIASVTDKPKQADHPLESLVRIFSRPGQEIDITKKLAEMFIEFFKNGSTPSSVIVIHSDQAEKVRNFWRSIIAKTVEKVHKDMCFVEIDAKGDEQFLRHLDELEYGSRQIVFFAQVDQVFAASNLESLKGRFAEIFNKLSAMMQARSERELYVFVIQSNFLDFFMSLFPKNKLPLILQAKVQGPSLEKVASRVLFVAQKYSGISVSDEVGAQLAALISNNSLDETWIDKFFAEMNFENVAIVDSGHVQKFAKKYFK